MARDLEQLLHATHELIATEAEGRQSVVSTAASAVPTELLKALRHHLRYKAMHQTEILERSIFCQKRLIPLEQERKQLEVIGMKVI